jgi:L-alanine-DL-glutamate epimerase-like enolase superfamily enzyme
VKIIGVDVYDHQLSYAHGAYAMSGGRVATHQSSTIVRIRTDDGVHGWGESCALGANYLPMFPGGTRAAIAELAPALLGQDPRETVAIGQLMGSRLRGFHDAKSALDIACWDILGKHAGLPVAVLLGGVLQDQFPLYEAVPLAPPAQMAEFIAARRAAGIDCFQVKVGNRPHDDAARARAAVEAAPDSRHICDANGGWRLQDAIIAVREMGDLPVYVEQPCLTLEDSARVRRVTDLPLVLDECVVTSADLHRALEVAGAGSVNLKLSRLGGITPMRQLRDQAVALGMTVSLEDTWGGDIVTAAVAHLAASTAAEDLLSASYFNTWTNEHVATTRPLARDGRGSAPTGSGLGVEIDLDALGEPLFSI